MILPAQNRYWRPKIGTYTKCNRLAPKDYEQYLNDLSKQFYCIDCCNGMFPFNTLTDTQQQLTSKCIDYPEDLDVSNLVRNEFDQITKKVNDAMVTLNKCSTEDAEFEVNDCKYYSIDQFKSLKIKQDKKLSFCHLNIHSICAHIEELRIALALLDHKFDFICISESKIRDGIEPRVDISIDGYQYPEGMPTLASKGGVLIYIKNGINYLLRNDLSVKQDKLLESFFVEVINKNCKNDIVGVMYRHPSQDKTVFLDQFLQPLNEKLTKENKNIFLKGDFNFNFLDLEDQENMNFFQSMMSNHLLPCITIPTKINHKVSTVIDNIFTNTIYPDSISGNLTFSFSDNHFAIQRI